MNFIEYTLNKPKLNGNLLTWEIHYLSGEIIRETDEYGRTIAFYKNIPKDSIQLVRLYVTEEIERLGFGAKPFVEINFPSASTRLIWRMRTIQRLKNNELIERIFLLGWKEALLYLHFQADSKGQFHLTQIRVSDSENNIELYEDEK